MNTTNRCAICRRRLTEAEIEGGLIVRVEEGFVCELCTPKIEARFAGESGGLPGKLAEKKYGDGEFQAEGEGREDEDARASGESERVLATDDEDDEDVAVDEESFEDETDSDFYSDDDEAEDYDEDADEDADEESFDDEAGPDYYSDDDEAEADEEGDEYEDDDDDDDDYGDGDGEDDDGVDEEGESVENDSDAPASASPLASPIPHPVCIEEDILREMRAISNTLLYEKASIWNVFGGIAQVLVFGVLVLTVLRWQAWGQEGLLLAILLQLATLTFFIKGK